MKESKQTTSEPADSPTPWYRDGLKFQCTQCGDCCGGDPGYVFVDEDETRAMAERLDLTVDEFEHQFIRKVGRRRSLKEYPDGDCVLLDPNTRRCLVYEARPIQCRTWPFWDSNLASPEDWAETCDVCPGSGRGKLYTLDAIEAARKSKSV